MTDPDRMMPIISFDPEANAMYIELRPGKLDRTVAHGDILNVDLDVDDEPIGVEILFPSGRRRLSLDEAMTKIDDEYGDALKTLGEV